LVGINGISFSIVKVIRKDWLWLTFPIILGLLLRLPRLGAFDNNYYTATVKSMTLSWSNFFYGSFDPSGLVMVDKPPAAFWLQSLSGFLLGVGDWSVTLPQFIMGIVSIPLIYFIVGRTFGRIAGIVSASVLAVLPASVIIDTRNEPDALVAFCLLLAAACIIKAVQTSQWKWLIFFSVLIALGFNSKMFVAFVPLPIFMTFLFFGWNKGWKKSLMIVAVTSTLTLLLSSLWISAVGLAPSDSRPYVGSTRDNSIWTLTFEYNGFRRFDGFGGGPRMGLPRPGSAPLNISTQPTSGLVTAPTTGLNPVGATPTCLPQNLPPGMVSMPQHWQGIPPCPTHAIQPGIPPQSGQTIFGLFSSPLSIQLGWLLPIGLLLLIPIIMFSLPRSVYGKLNKLVKHLRHDELASQSFLWGGWLIITLIIFGSANATHTHPYYLVAASAPLSAVIGIGISSLWKAVRIDSRSAWFLVAILVTGLVIQIYGARNSVSEIAVIGSLVLASIGLLVFANGIRQDVAKAPLTSYGLLIGISVFLIVPFFTALGSDGRLVGPPRPPQPSSLSPVNPPLARDPGIENRIIEYLKWEIDPSTNDILLATQRARDAAPFILADVNTVAIGGFSGRDPIFDVDQFVEFADVKNVGFFLIGNLGPDGLGSMGQPPTCKPATPPPSMNSFPSNWLNLPECQSGQNPFPDQGQVSQLPLNLAIGRGRGPVNTGPGEISETIRTTWVDVSGLASLPAGTLYKNPNRH